jgi:SagB-type dehydrogenase family enzyme
MSSRWVVSEFTVMTWRAGRVEITSTASDATFATDDLELAGLAHAFARPRSVREVLADRGNGAEIEARIDNLIRAGIIVPANEPELAAAHHWDSSALAYHRRSRRPFRKTSGPAAAPEISMRSPEQWIPLARGSPATGRDLADVLDARYSGRAWSPAPLPFETFSRFLWLSARDRKSAGDFRHLSRAYPSGGATYSLELYPVIALDAVAMIAGGLYRYLSDGHGLEAVSTKFTEVFPFLEAAGRSAGAPAAPPIVVLITSRFAKQSEVYGDLAYSLILKEVGCLLQTLYLVGEALGLSVCALGGGSPSGRLARLRGTSEVAEPVVGELVFGPR